MRAAAEGVRIAHGAVAGRLRLEVPEVRGRPERARRLAAALGEGGRFEAVEARALTGSLILRFDPGLAAEAVVREVGAALRGLDRDGAGAEAAGGGPLPRPASPRTGTPRPAPAGRAPSGRAGVERFGSGPVPSGAPRAGGPGAGRPAAEAWFALPAGAAVERFGSDAERGLDPAAAEAALGRHGPNRLPEEAPPGALALFLRQFSGLPVLMLTGSSIVSLASGGVADAVATLSVVLVNGVLGFVTEGQAERVIHGLMDTAGQPAAVVRGGAEAEVQADRLVPGDLILLRPGIRVAADARLVAARRLKLDESSLTGESLPVAKAAEAEVAPDAPIGERPTMVHAGTIVAEGTGRAVVVATGTGTEAARTHLLATTGGRPQAPVEAELDRLGRGLALASLAACGVFAAIGLARGYPAAAILKDALALAVAAVPEGLPMVATSTLSMGLRKMERRGILIRQMRVVESLGAIEVLCLDKTGTLTENRMAVTAAVAGLGEVDPGDRAVLARIAEIAALNNDCAPEGEDGSETERALVRFAAAQGVDVAALRAARPRLATVERAPGRPWMATVHGGTGPRCLVKGSPEALLAASSHLADGDGVRPLGEAERARLLELNDRLASRPARVLGFAFGDAEPGEDEALPGGLVFAGLVGMTDPIRPGAREFVARMQRAGIATVLITGDQAATAGAIARELDLGAGGPVRIVESTALGELSPELLAGLARDARVFARVASHEKMAIVKALQASGRVVAMTGDGVNDGPALNAADVGIAMGRSGADLARSVANVVIRDDELGTLVEAVAEGRGIYRNIRRSLEFLVTTNMSEIAVALVEALHGPGELETPMELLWINLVTDVLPGLGLALAAPDRDAMDLPPRPAGEPIIPEGHMRRMALDSGLVAGAALAAHFVGLARHGPGPATRGMTFLALSQGQLLYTLVCQRSDPRHLDPARLLENRPLDAALLVSSALGALPFFSPFLRRLLGIAPLGAADVAVALGAAAVPFAAVLARRGVQIELEEREVRPCGTSS